MNGCASLEEGPGKFPCISERNVVYVSIQHAAALICKISNSSTAPSMLKYLYEISIHMYRIVHSVKLHGQNNVFLQGGGYMLLVLCRESNTFNLYV